MVPGTLRLMIQYIDDRVAGQRTSPSQPASPNSARSLDRRSPGREDPTLIGNGSFYQAHNFVLNRPVFRDGSAIDESKGLLDTSLYWSVPLTGGFIIAIRKLAQHVLIGAEFDSSARDPPPRCYEQTRESTITKIEGWLYNTHREKKLLWLNGPAGVGKSAIMQTLADAAARLGRLGASLFFSRLNQRNDPDKVVPTLAFQLALAVPSYRAYIVEQLTLNPLLPSKNIREQFHKLIVEPFAIRHVCTSDNIRCVLLDGLDECQGEDAQCNIIQLISDFIHQYPDTPVVWIVATRPEEHLKIKFALPDISLSHWQLHIPIDDVESRQDVQRYLRGGFEAIRLKYPHATSWNWPTDADFSKIAIVASGLFIFASTIIRFVADPGVSDPVSQLQLVLCIIDRSAASFDEHPFAVLDALYAEILSSLHPITLRYVHLLLGHLLLRGLTPGLPDSEYYTLLSVSNILNLKPNVVYGALQKLHSVLYVPPRNCAHQQHIRFLHASFSDYLRNKQRSKAFAINLTEVHRHIWWSYHRIVQQANDDPGQSVTHNMIGYHLMTVFSLIGIELGNPSKISLSWPRDDLEETRHLSISLFREARYFWAHHLVSACYCYHISSSPCSVNSLSLTTSERLNILQEINYNRLIERYCGIHVKHVFAFCTWFLDCWNVSVLPVHVVLQFPNASFLSSSPFVKSCSAGNSSKKYLSKSLPSPQSTLESWHG